MEQLKVMDFGIGITKESQRYLDGFYHTLDTDLYTSKKPYNFGAKGKGWARDSVASAIPDILTVHSINMSAMIAFISPMAVSSITTISSF